MQELPLQAFDEVCWQFMNDQYSLCSLNLHPTYSPHLATAWQLIWLGWLPSDVTQLIAQELSLRGLTNNATDLR